MNGRLAPEAWRAIAGALLGLGWLATAGAADNPATRSPALRTTSTPAGLMLSLEEPSTAVAPAKAASTPALDTVMIEGRPVRVLREPAATPAASARSLSAVANPSPALQAQAMPNGSQMLVLPSGESMAPAVTPALTIVDIDPSRLGTRAGDSPQAATLYRKPPAALPARSTR